MRIPFFGDRPSAAQRQERREKDERVTRALHTLMNSSIINDPPVEGEDHLTPETRQRMVDIVLTDGCPVDWADAYTRGVTSEQKAMLLNAILETPSSRADTKKRGGAKEAIGLLLHGPIGGGPVDNWTEEQERQFKAILES